jgi:hypothetical protein
LEREHAIERGRIETRQESVHPRRLHESASGARNAGHGVGQSHAPEQIPVTRAPSSKLKELGAGARGRTAVQA